MKRSNLGFWTNKHNQKIFFERIAKKLNVNKVDDWYTISTSQIKNLGGSSLISFYGHSLFKALSSIYTTYDWKAWRFKYNSVPDGFWKNYSNQIAFMEDMGKKLGVNYPMNFESNWKEWYNVKKSDITENGGGGLLSLYNNSPSKLVMTIYSQYPWNPSEFQVAPNGHWKSVANQRTFFDNLAKTIGISKWEDWYKVSYCTILEHGGGGLLHSNPTAHPFLDSAFSLPSSTPSFSFDLDSTSNKEEAEETGKPVRVDYRKILKTVYPEHNWKLWKFERVPAYYLSDTDMIKEMVQFVEESLGITDPNDWYFVSYPQMESLGCSNLLKHFGGIIPIVQMVYPHMEWDQSYSQHHHASRNLKIQRQLYKAIGLVFPNVEEIYVNYPHPVLSYTN